MLSLQNLSITLKQHILCHPFSLSIQAGQCVGILGANGVGKSTLLKAIGQDLPHQGAILWRGKNIAELNLTQRAKQLAFLPQQTQLNFAFSVYEIVEMGAMMYAISKQELNVMLKYILDIFDISALRNKNFLTLSGGEKQRVQAARVWMQVLASTEKKLILLDEPTSALDLKHQHQFLQQCRQLAQQGHLVLIVLHDLNLASRYCDQLFLLQQGGFYAYGTPAELLTVTNIQYLYQYHAEIYQQSGQVRVW